MRLDNTPHVFHTAVRPFEGVVFKTLYRALPGVKCFFTRPKNLCPKLVLTFLLYGGLYQVIFLLLRAGFCLSGAGSGSL